MTPDRGRSADVFEQYNRPVWREILPTFLVMLGVAVGMFLAVLLIVAGVERAAADALIVHTHGSDAVLEYAQ